jgi:DNA-binding Lrp family transcriptional regulator
MSTERLLDDQERAIVRALIRDPRESDNAIGLKTGVNVRSVGRKRQRLEEEGILTYFTHVDLSERGTGQFPIRHLYIITFRNGITHSGLVADIQKEPFVRSLFTEVIFESHIAEIDGKLAMLLFIDGASEKDIVETVQGQLIPSLLKNHGEGSVEEVRTIRVLSPVRMLRNYIMPVNVRNGYLKPDWPDDAIYMGKPAPEAQDETP